MADYRTYYGHSLLDSNRQQPLYSTQQQITPHTVGGSLARTVGYGLGVGTLIGTGFIRYRGAPLWNRYVRSLQAIEEYSPGRVLRTFQVSSFFSQFADPLKMGRATEARLSANFLSGSQLAANPIYHSYLSSLIGGVGTSRRLREEGVFLRGNRLFFGGGEQALRYARGIFGPENAFTRLGESHFLSMGFDPGYKLSNLKAFRRELRDLPLQIVGGQTRRQYIARQTGAIATEAVSRFNRLFEMEPIKSASEALGKWGIQFGVKPGKSYQVLGRLVGKYGVGLPLAYLGYQSLDYLGEEYLGAGPSDLIADAITGTNLMASRIAEVSGLHEYRERQEAIAPGSTSLSRLAGFSALGGLTGMMTAYGLRVTKMAKLQYGGMTAAEASEEATEYLKAFKGKGWLSILGKKVTREEGVYTTGIGRLSNLLRKISSPVDTGELYFKYAGKIGPGKLLTAGGAALGAILMLPFLPGALVPSTRPDELEDIYSGRKEVPIRRGRWWEFGKTPHEGTRVDYYRPHWYARRNQRGREVAIYGEKPLSPWQKFVKREFTYELEREHYRSRPYPVTSLPFEDVPFVGPLLAFTLGKLIKPEIYMHQEEWMTGEGAVDFGPGFGERVATELGEVPMGLPVSPHGLKALIGEQIYRMTEMTGLWGFLGESIKEKITGTPSFFEEERQLESARRIAGFEREYWDLNLGGLAGTTEIFRRLYPHRRRQIELYNPIRNLMPTWLPGPGDKSPDFLHGDPFTKVPEGEIRLPGEGYATRFPELKGITPEDYPLIHKYKILADIAPYSDAYRRARDSLQGMRSRGEWSEYEEDIYMTTKAQVKIRKQGKQFNEYVNLSPAGDIFEQPIYYGGAESSGMIAAINRMKASNREKPGVFSRFFGGYFEVLAHNADTAIDQLTPMSPAAKLIHMRTAIEDYEVTQLYGTQNSFWNHPLRDFIRPFLSMTARGLGWSDIPEHIEHRREVEEYFDVLKYVKYSRLSTMARESHDMAAVKEFERYRNETLFGVNPYTMNYSNLYRSLPRRERDYFESFENAKTEQERAQILQMVPDNLKGIYQARWGMALANDIRTAQKAGLLTDDQMQEGREYLAQIKEESSAEGMPKTQELWVEYLKTKLRGENYGDWYRRVVLLPQLPNLPAVDWVGWHPSVDLEDIKLKLVQDMGEDMHDYNLWPSRERRMMNKPYINTQSIEVLTGGDELTAMEMRERVDELLLANNIRNSDAFVRHSYTTIGQPSVTIDYIQESEEKSLLEEMFG